MRVVVFVLTGCVLAGCGLPQNVVVLIPDEAGQVGSALVTNVRGQSELSSSLAAVSLDPGVAPSKPFPVDRQPVDAVFARALSAAPQPPAMFTITFSPGTAELTADSRDAFQAAVATAQRTPTPDIGLATYSNPDGPPQETPALRQQRAQIVRDALVRAGVPATVIEGADYGTANPIVPADAPAPAKARNDRVTITIR